MIFIPATEEHPALWLNPAHMTLVYQHDSYLIILFCDKSRLNLAGDSMAIVLEALKESQVNYEPIPNLNELID